jgi:hypothetical protein
VRLVIALQVRKLPAIESLRHCVGTAALGCPAGQSPAALLIV